MKVGFCGIACELCTRMTRGTCPGGSEGCGPNEHCAVSTCAFERSVSTCFECEAFPCETTKSGPIDYEHCKFMAGRAG